MKLAKKAAEYTVLKRRDGRYAVQGKNGKFINAEEKVKILIAEGLVTAPEPKAKEEPVADADVNNEEASAEAVESGEDTTPEA